MEPNDGEAYYYRGYCNIGLAKIVTGCTDLNKAKELGYAKAQEAIHEYCK